MIKPLIFSLFFAIIPTILGNENEDREKGGGIGEDKTWADMPKVFDDPYLAAVEKDTDVYDAVENRFLNDIIAPKKLNHYKEMKKRPSPPTIDGGGLDRLMTMDDRGKIFAEMATFNYGMIGMLKKQFEEEKAGVKNDEAENEDQRRRWWSSSEEVGWEKEEKRRKDEGPNVTPMKRIPMMMIDENENGVDWKKENATFVGNEDKVDSDEKHFDENEMAVMKGRNSKDEMAKENLDLDTVGWFE